VIDEIVATWRFAERLTGQAVGTGITMLGVAEALGTALVIGVPAGLAAASKDINISLCLLRNVGSLRPDPAGRL